MSAAVRASMPFVRGFNVEVVVFPQNPNIVAQSDRAAEVEGGYSLAARPDQFPKRLGEPADKIDLPHLSIWIFDNE